MVIVVIEIVCISKSTKIRPPLYLHTVIGLLLCGTLELIPLIRYAGEKFEVTWEVAENVLVRVYTKDLKEKGTRIRLERQEYPNKTFVESVEEKLNAH